MKETVLVLKDGVKIRAPMFKQWKYKSALSGR